MKKLIQMLLSVAMFVTTACEGSLSDLIWTQSGNVTVGSVDIDKCVASALVDVPNVAIDHTLSQPVDIVLKVKLERPIPSLGVYVRRLNSNTLQVMFTGKGSREPDDARAVITPLLETITSHIRKSCT